MGGKNLVHTFSYNLKDAEVIDECIKIARQDGVSFSEFVVSLLKEQARQKKAIGDQTPINISYGNREEKPFQTDLTQWIEQIHQAKDDSDMLNIFEGMGRNIMVTAKHYLEENRRRRIMRK